MKDKTIVITGATGGIGKQTAVALARMGAHVIITGRNQKTGDATIEEIKRLSANPRVDLLLADLSEQIGVRSLSAQFHARFARLDVLINNAGLAAPERRLTSDGIEADFATNVIAPFMLTHLLMDRLKASTTARVITVTGGDVKGVLDLDNLQGEKSFKGLTRYSNTKLAMMALMLEWAQRNQGSSVNMNVCYPGQASTGMTRGVTAGMLPGVMRLAWPLFRVMVRDDGGRSAAKASRSSVFLASSADVADVSGRYFSARCKETPWPAAIQYPLVRRRLWDIVEQLVKP